MLSVGNYNGADRGAGIAAVSTGSEYAADLAIITGAAGATSNERARFTSDGKALINRTTDDGTGAKLQVNGSISSNGVVIQPQVKPAFAGTILTTPVTDNASIPFDNTKPQNTEGVAVMSVSITPKSSTSTLVIRATVSGTRYADGGTSAIALFRDSNPDALAATFTSVASSGGGVTGHLEFFEPSGSTSSRTYYIRAGMITGNSGWQINAGTSGTNTFGGVASTVLTVMEML